MKLVYLGTPQFAVPSLERLVEAGHEVGRCSRSRIGPRDAGKKTRCLR